MGEGARGRRSSLRRRGVMPDLDPDEACYHCGSPGLLAKAFDLDGLPTYVCSECLERYFDDTNNEVKRKPQLPFILRQDADFSSFPPWPFPFWGGTDWEPLVARRKLVAGLFADKSGLGVEDDPALTLPQLRCRLQELLVEHGDLAIAIYEEGMFQVRIGVWTTMPTEKIQ